MKKVVVNENQKGILTKNGKYVKVLDAGTYRITGSKIIEASKYGGPVKCMLCPLVVLLEDKNFASAVSVVDVKDQQLVFHFVNGIFEDVITKTGKHAYWNGKDAHEFRVVDISDPEVPDDFPRYLFDMIPSDLFTKVKVSEYEKARLYYDRRIVKILEPGTYYFWKNNICVDTDSIDTRLTKLDITGQEVMTQDKVTLRINFVCNYRVTDYLKCITEIYDYEEMMHVAAQLALREYVGKHKLDEILENKEEISKYVFEKLKEKESELYVEFTDAGVKDIILPGEIRDIMNTVLVAEKKAQANVITRREEVASTRSLLNTAKLMDENQTLYKLKELEFVERICENVGNINLNGNGDMLSQLLGMMESRKPA